MEGVFAGPCERWLSFQSGFRSESGKRFGNDLMTGTQGLSNDCWVPVWVFKLRPPITWAAVGCENSTQHRPSDGRGTGCIAHRIRHDGVFPQWFILKVIWGDLCGEMGEYAIPKYRGFRKGLTAFVEVCQKTPPHSLL
jgi:hypothetical protein